MASPFVESAKSGLRVLGESISAFYVRLQAQAYNDQVIDLDEVEELHFAFYGEFGYGLQSWIPYVNFIKSRFEGKVVTYGPPGSSPFYYFSDVHREVAPDHSTMTFGALQNYAALVKKFALKKLFFPSNQTRRDISIGDYRWMNHQSRGVLDVETNYKPLELSGTLKNQLGIDSPYVVVNNKNYFNWGNVGIENFFAPTELYSFAEKLKDRGKIMVYNAMPLPADSENIYFDQEVDFGEHDNVVDMRSVYEDEQGLTARNKIQIDLLKNAECTVAVQGGNAVLSLVCGTDTHVLMRGGFDYPYYLGLKKAYGVMCECFYQPGHLFQHVLAEKCLGLGDAAE